MRAWLELPHGAHLRLLAMGRPARPGGEERGGLLLGSRDSTRRARVTLVTRAANVSPGDRRGRFELDPGHLVRAAAHAARRRWCVLGTWHTHPSGPGALALSSADRALAWEGAYLLVVAAGSGRGESRDPHSLAGWQRVGPALWAAVLSIPPPRSGPGSGADAGGGAPGSPADA